MSSSGSIFSQASEEDSTYILAVIPGDRGGEISDDSYDVVQPTYHNFPIVGNGDMGFNENNRASAPLVQERQVVADGHTGTEEGGNLASLNNMMITEDSAYVNMSAVNLSGGQHAGTEGNGRSYSEGIVALNVSENGNNTYPPVNYSPRGRDQRGHLVLQESRTHTASNTAQEHDTVTNRGPVVTAAEDASGWVDSIIILSDDDDDDSAMFENPRGLPFEENMGTVTTTNDDREMNIGVCNSASFPMAVGNATEKLRLVTIGSYTALQKWEFEQGLPVDGVENVEKWALEHGLTRECSEDGPPSKRRKLDMMSDPPKYGEASSSGMYKFEEEAVTGTVSDDEETVNDDMEIDSTDDYKGKKPLQDQ